MPTHRENFYRKHGIPLDKSLSLKEISKLSGVPMKALQEIKKRGEGAWGNNIASVRLMDTYAKNPNTTAYPRSSRLSMNQWSFARIYSFLDRGTTYRTADADIAKKYGI